MDDDARALHLVEAALADSQPFGDCDYIWQRLCRHYRRRVEMLGDYSEYGRELLAALDRVPVEEHRRILGDPVVRVAVDDWLSYDKTGGEPFSEDDFGRVLGIAAQSADAGAAVPPLAEGAADYFRVSESPWPWVWSKARVDYDPLGDFFLRRLFRRFNQGHVLATPGPSQREMLVAGTRLLHVLCPKLARSAMSHVHLIGVVNSSAGFTSLTDPKTPGMIYLSPAVLTNPWQAAENLLHEAMHVKFIDLEHTHSLMNEDYRLGTSPRIRPHWNRAHPGSVNEWPVNRALTVLHVYTCLALFFTRAANRSVSLEEQYGPLHLNPTKEARRSFDRAHYLRYQLEHYEGYLGFAGMLFVRWLGGLLHSFDASPPPEGSYVHLVLDLYEREADQVRALVTSLGKNALRDDALWGEMIREAARREIGSTLTALSMIADAPQASRQLQKQDEALVALEAAKASFRDSADAFLSVRSSVSEILRSIPPTAYVTTLSADGGKAPSDVIRAMVEDSGTHLNALFDVASSSDGK